MVALIIEKMNVPYSKGAANSQGHLQGDGVLSEVDLVVVAGDHMPHNTRGNSTRLQPTYRRLCTQHGARRETRGIVEGAHRDYMRGMAEPLMEIVVDNKPLRALVDTRNYILHCNKRHNHR